MTTLEDDIRDKMRGHGVDFIHFVDISQLSAEQNRGFSSALLFGIPLSTSYIEKVLNTPDYTEQLVESERKFADDEILQKENATDILSDMMADYLSERGYSAFSQSDSNLISSGCFDGTYGKTSLPNKKIAVLGGVGWIGKNCLLVTPEYGSALCLGAVLTNAPLKTLVFSPILPKCGTCNICVDACKPKVLTGKMWETGISREEMIDVYMCSTCLTCLLVCPWTKIYVQRDLLED